MWEFVQLIRLLIQRADVTPHLQQLATICVSSCHPMRESIGQDARLCRALLTQMSEFAGRSNRGARDWPLLTRSRTVVAMLAEAVAACAEAKRPDLRKQ